MNTPIANNRSYNFTLILSGFHQLSDEVEDGFYGGGCDDAILGIRNQVPYLEFDRVSDSLPNAILSAIQDVHQTRLARVVRVEPGDVVNASAIAQRAGRSREWVRLLIKGDRGPGQFPAPIDGLRSPSPLWSWADVAVWMSRELKDTKVTHETAEMAQFSALLNHTLGLTTSAKPRVAKQMWQCVQPGHKHSNACRNRDWLKELEIA